MPGFELTILHDFEDYARGMFVTDVDEIKRILASEHALRVVKVPAGTHEVAEPVAETAAVVTSAAVSVAKVVSPAPAVVSSKPQDAAPASSSDAAKA